MARCKLLLAVLGAALAVSACGGVASPPKSVAGSAEQASVASPPKSGADSPAKPQFIFSCDLHYRNESRWNRPAAEAFLEEIRKYGGPAAPVVDQVRDSLALLCGKPSCRFVEWLGEGKGLGTAPVTRLDMLDRVRVAVHEEGHQFAAIAGIGTVYRTARYSDTTIPNGVALIGNDRIVSVRLPDGGVLHVPVRPVRVFPAREISRYFTDSALRTDRYPVYIESASPHQGTQSGGIYGLLDEYYAYFYSMLAEDATMPERLDLLRKYNNPSNRSRAALPFELEANGDSTAFFEFKLWILRYLQHARERYPELYKTLMESRPLVQAIVAIHDPFEERARKSIERADRQMKPTISKKELDQLAGRIPDHTGHLNFDYHPLVKELQRPENVAMMAEIRRLAAVK